MGTKWIVVTGGVLSGLGKGIVTSSIGAILKAQGHTASASKIDPYINIDAGTMRPTEHGEVFVTFDGGETDQDLGNYERFFDQKIGRKNNITTGQVFQEVIKKERNLEYGGRNVQVMRDIPAEIIRRLRENATEEFMIVEIGGTVGDYENVLFLEAVKQMKRQGEQMMFVHVSYMPMLSNVGELKTKPTQHSVRALNANGIFADLIVVRAKTVIDEPRREKISVFCNVTPDQIISAPDVGSIYQVPVNFYKQTMAKKILNHFDLECRETDEIKKWERFVEKAKDIHKEITIGVVGKYFDIGDNMLEDSYISVIEAIKAAGIAENIKPNIKWIDSKEFESNPDNIHSLKIHAIIVPGGFGSSGVEGKIKTIQFCRENNIPFLGLCYGMQLAVVEFARHIGLDAHTTEVDKKTPHPVITILEEQKKLLEQKQFGNSMRLGDYKAILVQNSKVANLYGTTEVVERHRHRYEVNPEYVDQLEKKGLVFSGKNPDRGLMEFIELPDHPYFVATQAHPEFLSRPMKPHPLFLGLIKAAKQQKPL